MITSQYAPVLLTVFNRPQETEKMIEALKEAKPSKIFVSADGPRPDRPDDLELCQKVRSLVIENIDWDAEVITDYADTNLGLRKRMSSAISWALSQVDRIIILEDDCVPDVSFFRFCTELLEKYSTDRRIGSITGDNFQTNDFHCTDDYYFSRYPHIWGWATWKRAWDYYDVGMQDWCEIRNTDWLHQLFPEKLEAEYWKCIFDDTFSGKINTWDYQWVYTCWQNNMLTITPRVNLVKNIGTGTSATNTCVSEQNKHNRAVGRMKFPLRHPHQITPRVEADKYVQKEVFGLAKDRSILGRIQRLARKIKKIKV
jgi:hypothetical protein